MVLVLLADGFEELEALTPVDVLRRGGIEVLTVGIGSREIRGTHGITVVADVTAADAPIDRADAIIFPGGMPGALNLDSSPDTDRIIDAVTKRGGRLAAICAAPLILGRRGLLDGRMATCFPGFESELRGATVTNTAVITDGHITTARDYRAAMAFADELCVLLKEDDNNAK